MSLQIYNSLTQQKEIFKPLIPGQVSLYVCGMTVYDYNHIGHARSFIVFDTIVRYLREIGYRVHYVRNITDIDDKIIRRAHETNQEWTAITQQFIQAMHEDDQALGLASPDQEPRATEFIAQMIKMIQGLIAQGYAYAVENGDVYFEVRRFKEYGKLSHHDLDHLLAGVRIDTGEKKKDPLDFALWKSAKPGEPSWDSPWGKGRPGWHIECSAMSTSLLGQPFDIHGGGLDLKFPHHENEIAQAEAAHQAEFAKIWMHAGLLMVNKEKMSKSLGNFLTIRDVLAKHQSEVLRYLMIASHYRSAVNYSEETMAQNFQSLSRLYGALRDLPIDETAAGDNEYQTRFYESMNDDFNTPEALAVLFDLTRDINRLRGEGKLQQAAQLAGTLKKLGKVLGILQQSPELFLKGFISEESSEQIEKLIALRREARQKKDWAAADKIRDQLLEMNVILEDASEGTIWRRH
jgi:cysteinyl-tRNA synthetase